MLTGAKLVVKPSIALQNKRLIEQLRLDHGVTIVIETDKPRSWRDRILSWLRGGWDA